MDRTWYYFDLRAGDGLRVVSEKMYKTPRDAMIGAFAACRRFGLSYSEQRSNDRQIALPLDEWLSTGGLLRGRVHEFVEDDVNFDGEPVPFGWLPQVRK